MKIYKYLPKIYTVVNNKMQIFIVSSHDILLLVGNINLFRAIQVNFCKQEMSFTLYCLWLIMSHLNHKCMYMHERILTPHFLPDNL